MSDFAAARIDVGRMRRINGTALALVGIIFLLEGCNLLRFNAL
jgi:hypothetical protein